MNITAALAVKRIMEREKLAGTIVVWPGVAEELVAAKAFFVRDGLFKDVDVVLFSHVPSSMGVSWGSAAGNGLVSVEYTFKGQSAHSAGMPWRGRSALDAVELMDIGWNFRREHLRLQQRSHYVITDGGDQPNVVPSTASVWYYFRETDYPRIKEMWDIGNRMADAAAMMTDTTVTSRVLGAAWPQHFNKVVAETTYANIQHVGMPKWDDADQALAKAVQREMKQAERGLETEVGRLGEPVRDEDNRGGGSDDIGDVSWTVPTITLRYPANIPGTTGPPLVERHRHGHAHRPQGLHDRRQGPRAHDARPAAEAGARTAGVGLLHDRADEGPEVHAPDPPRGQAGDVPQREDHGRVPRADEAVLLRSVEVQDVPGAAGRAVSAASRSRPAK